MINASYYRFLETAQQATQYLNFVFHFSLWMLLLKENHLKVTGRLL